jgi:hypothetical protein
MRALIIDQGLDRGSLAAVRALRDDGWTVGVGSPVRGLAGSSRAVSRWHEVPAAERGLSEYLETVLARSPEEPATRSPRSARPASSPFSRRWSRAS